MQRCRWYNINRNREYSKKMEKYFKNVLAGNPNNTDIMIILQSRK
jgi:hypothetical protein